MKRYLLILVLLFLPSLLRASIEIVYHVATLNSWEEVVCEQLTTLERSGLGSACDRLTVTVVGPHIDKAKELFRRFSFYPKVLLIHASEDVRVAEFPGIEMVKKIALEREDANILYMHSKGITHLQNDRTRNVRSWRRYLEYFLIERWEACIEALQTFNLCGVEWLNCTKSMAPCMENPGIFAGNFWWARADYLRTCKDVPPRPWDPSSLYRDRYHCEVFIASGQNPLPKSFHQSGTNLYEFNYTADYYKEAQLPKQGAIEIVYLAIATADRLPCLKEHLQLLQETGLAASSDRISLIVLGPELKKVEELILPLSDKMRLIYASSRLPQGEFPAFELIKRIAQTNPSAKICYLHNFGDKYPKAPPSRYKSIGHAIRQTLIRKRKEAAAWLKSVFFFEKRAECKSDHSRMAPMPKCAGVRKSFRLLMEVRDSEKSSFSGYCVLRLF